MVNNQTDPKNSNEKQSQKQQALREALEAKRKQEELAELAKKFPDQFQLQPIVGGSEAQEKEVEDKTIQSLVILYKQTFERDPEESAQGNPVFLFANPEDAEQFFQKAADLKLRFLTFKMADGKYTGEYFMSTGDGELIKGEVPVAQLDDIKQKFLNNEKPEPQPSSTLSGSK